MLHQYLYESIFFGIKQICQEYTYFVELISENTESFDDQEFRLLGATLISRTKLEGVGTPAHGNTGGRINIMQELYKF